MSVSAGSTSNSAQAHYNAGKALYQAGEYETALTEFQDALRRTPESAAVHFWIGKAQVGRGNTEEALNSFQHSIRLDPTNVKPHLEMGRAYVAADQLGAAAASFRQAQRLSPQSAEPLREIAAVLIQQCQYDAALEELQRALALEQGAALTHVLFGRVYDLKGMRQQADAAYRESERLDPRVYAQAQVANGAQMQAAGRLGDAVKQYRAATLTDPTYMEAFTRLGSACFDNYQKVDAADAFRAATCLAPNDYSTHYLLGYTLLYQSQVNLKTVVFKRKVAPPDEAIKALLRAVDLDPNRTDAHFALGKAYEAAGVRHLAREQMERVLALDSNGRDAVSAREALRTLYQTDRARD